MKEHKRLLLKGSESWLDLLQEQVYGPVKVLLHTHTHTPQVKAVNIIPLLWSVFQVLMHYIMEITSVGLFVWITDHLYFLTSAEIKNLVMHVIIYQSNFAVAEFVPTTLRKPSFDRQTFNTEETNVLLIYSTSTEVQLQFCFIKHKIIVKQITFSIWKTCIFKCLHACFMFCIRFYSSSPIY